MNQFLFIALVLFALGIISAHDASSRYGDKRNYLWAAGFYSAGGAFAIMAILTS